MIGRPRASAIHCAVGSSSGSPARNSARSDDRSCFFSAAGSCFFSTRTAVGALNIDVTWYFSTRLHQTAASGASAGPRR
jgi:hypothetical protein